MIQKVWCDKCNLQFCLTAIKTLPAMCPSCHQQVLQPLPTRKKKERSSCPREQYVGPRLNGFQNTYEPSATTRAYLARKSRHR